MALGRRPSPYLLLVLAPLFWSGNFVVARAVRAAVPPLALSFWRWVLALGLLLPFAWPSLRDEWGIVRRSWRILAVLGVLGVGNFSALAYVGLRATTATNGVLLNSVAPVLIVVLAWLFLGQRLSGWQTAGVLLSLAGVLAIVTRGEPAAVLGLHVSSGDLWILAAVASWAAYSICLRWRPKGLSAMPFMVATMAVGLLWLAPFYAWEVSTGARLPLTAASAATLAYVVVFPSLLSYLCWNRGVAEVGPSRAGIFLHLMPLFGTLLSIAFLGESFRLFHLTGMVLIFAGIYLATAARPLLSLRS